MSRKSIRYILYKALINYSLIIYTLLLNGEQYNTVTKSDRSINIGLEVNLNADDSQIQVDACARCHSLRSIVTGNYEYGKDLMDFYVPQVLVDEFDDEEFLNFAIVNYSEMFGYINTGRVNIRIHRDIEGKIWFGVGISKL